MKPQQGDLLPDKNADRRRLSHEASRVVHLAFALIKYVPLAVKSCRLHFFRVGSTEEFASEAGTPLQIIITHLIAHVAHHRCSIQTAILRYNSVFLRTFCVPFSHSNIFTLGTSLPMKLMGVDKNFTGRFPRDENWSTKTANQVPPEKA